MSFPTESQFLHGNNGFTALISRITVPQYFRLIKIHTNFILPWPPSTIIIITISGTSQSFDLLLIMLNPFLVSFKIRIHLNSGWEESIPRCDWVNSTLIQLSTTIPTRIGISDPKITCFSILGKYQVKLFWSTGQSKLLIYSDTDQVNDELSITSLLQSSSKLISSHHTQ